MSYFLRFLVAFRRPADDLESETFQKAPGPGRPMRDSPQTQPQTLNTFGLFWDQIW